jgi:hypothetical protein
MKKLFLVVLLGLAACGGAEELEVAVSVSEAASASSADSCFTIYTCEECGDPFLYQNLFRTICPDGSYSDVPLGACGDPCF